MILLFFNNFSLQISFHWLCLLRLFSLIFIFKLSLSSNFFYFRYYLFQFYNSHLLFNIFEVFAYHKVHVFKCIGQWLVVNSYICETITTFQVLTMPLTPKSLLLPVAASACSQPQATSCPHFNSLASSGYAYSK